MRKRNAGGGDQTRKLAAKQRRIRRQEKLVAAVQAKVKGLIAKLGAAQARIRELERQQQPQPAEVTAGDSAQG